MKLFNWSDGSKTYRWGDIVIHDTMRNRKLINVYLMRLLDAKQMRDVANDMIEIADLFERNGTVAPEKPKPVLPKMWFVTAERGEERLRMTVVGTWEGSIYAVYGAATAKNETTRNYYGEGVCEMVGYLDRHGYTNIVVTPLNIQVVEDAK